MTLAYWEQRRLDLREKLLHHPLFAALKEPKHLQVFMEAHVFAVWDFMSLLKRLQRELTCVELPWLPPRDAEAARLINEIVLGEETDLTAEGAAQSHFELYVEAMQEMNADILPIRNFIEQLESSRSWKKALNEASCPLFVKEFTRASLEMACEGSREDVLGAFFYGREELIPALFQGLLDRWSLSEHSVPRFAYYIKRHIHLDQNEHGPAAERLLERLLGTDIHARIRVLEAACLAIESRLALWDGVLKSL